jgi:hypothetical protein
MKLILASLLAVASLSTFASSFEEACKGKGKLEVLNYERCLIKADLNLGYSASAVTMLDLKQLEKSCTEGSTLISAESKSGNNYIAVNCMNY